MCMHIEIYVVSRLQTTRIRLRQTMSVITCRRHGPSSRGSLVCATVLTRVEMSRKLEVRKLLLIKTIICLNRRSPNVVFLIWCRPNENRFRRTVLRAEIVFCANCISHYADQAYICNDVSNIYFLHFRHRWKLVFMLENGPKLNKVIFGGVRLKSFMRNFYRIGLLWYDPISRRLHVLLPLDVRKSSFKLLNVISKPT